MKILLTTLVIGFFILGHSAPTYAQRSIRKMEIQDAIKLVQRSLGQVVIFHLYASWCKPSVKEFPIINDVAGRYYKQGVVRIALSVDNTSADAVRFLTGYYLNFQPIWLFQTHSGNDHFNNQKYWWNL